jgi:hypothetical protein
MTHAIAAITTPPAADELMVDPQTVPAGRREFIPRYGDTRWSFLAMSENPSAADDVINWDRFPAELREPFRHAAWVLAREPLSADELSRHGPAMRSRLSSGSIYRSVRDWRKFALWMLERGITSLAAVTVEDLTDYSVYLAKTARLARNTCIQHLVALTRLHLYSTAYLPAEHQLAEPPWLTEGMDDYLPAASPVGENVTEPLTPATMGPLLVWAMRVVENFSPDILAAHRERGRMIEVAEQMAQVPGKGKDTLTAYLERVKRTGAPIPSRAGKSDRELATLYIAGLVGCSHERAHAVFAHNSRWRKLMEANPGPCPVGGPVTGMLGGKPWQESIEFDEVPTLIRHMVTACFVVIAYLTGMRPGEVLGLEVGCCPEPDTGADAARRHLIHGRQFKTARDEDGNHLSAGVVREAPWVAIPPVVKAIRVLEDLVGEGLLFDAVVHDPRSPGRRGGRSLATTTVANRMERFVGWINKLAASHGREAELIPPDPHIRVGIGRFRRTLAWHIARQPGGLVALAVQYGHMRTLISEGYGSRSRGGIHDLLDFETARSVAEHLSDVHEALQDGVGVSGPAARRLINSAAQEHHRFGGMVTTVRQARNLLADPTLNVFENKQSYLICNYDQSKALCHPGRGGKNEAPSLDRCRSTCANIARTDSHARQLEQAATRLLAQAESAVVPTPVADRLREKAAELRALAERHDRDRIAVADEATSDSQEGKS